MGSRWDRSVRACGWRLMRAHHALLLVGGGDLDGPGGYWDSSHAGDVPVGSIQGAGVHGRPSRGAVTLSRAPRKHIHHQWHQ